MEKHLLGGKGTLIFLSNMLNTSSFKEIQHKLASCYPWSSCVIQNILVFVNDYSSGKQNNKEVQTYFLHCM